MKLIPKSDYSDYYDIARFNLTWRLNVVLALVLPILAITLLSFQEFAAIPTFIGWGVTLIILFSLYRTKKYQIGAFSFLIIGIFLCTYTLLGFPDSYHFVDPLWMMMVILYGYFVLGKVWGNISLVICVSAIILYILTMLNGSLKLNPSLPLNERWALAINVVFCMLINSYLIYQFLKVSKHAEKEFRAINKELEEKNQKVERQNLEKTVMLKEIHHRVKNNLQVITSLLRLQTRDIDDPTTIENFKEATQRILAMALIHDKMYQSEDLANIDLEEYLKALLQDMIRSYAVEIPLESSISSKVGSIETKSLVPLALLFNELIANSLKHAFVEKSVGSIKIEVFKQEERIIIKYSDNGIWRAKQKSSSFGLELIDSLIEQLDGIKNFKIEQGSHYEFILPNNL